MVRSKRSIWRHEHPSGLTVLQYPRNPDYPGDWTRSPALSWCQPTFPAAGTRYALPRGKPLVLRYRLLIHTGAKPGDDRAAKLWDAYQATSAAVSVLHRVRRAYRMTTPTRSNSLSLL